MDEGGTDVGQPFIDDLLNFLFLGVARLMDIVVEVSERESPSNPNALVTRWHVNNNDGERGAFEFIVDCGREDAPIHEDVVRRGCEPSGGNDSDSAFGSTIGF